MKKIPIKFAYIRAVKNRLCRIEDSLSYVFIHKIPEADKKRLLMARLDIDSCIESLEKLLKLL